MSYAPPWGKQFTRRSLNFQDLQHGKIIFKSNQFGKKPAWNSFIPLKADPGVNVPYRRWPKEGSNTQCNPVRNFSLSQEISKQTQWIFSLNVAFNSVATGIVILYFPEDAKGVSLVILVILRFPLASVFLDGWKLLVPSRKDFCPPAPNPGW